MTVAFYISPGLSPAIAADYVVTEITAQGSRFSSKIGSELAGRGILNFEKNSLREIYSRKFARKTLIIDDLTAVSFAGNKSSGKKVLSAFLESNYRELERPIRKLGHIADEWNHSHPEFERVTFVGATVKILTDGGYGINSLRSPSGYSGNFGNFGLCHFTGSGTNDYISKISNIDAGYHGPSINDVPQDSQLFLHASLATICSDTIFNDYFLNESHPSAGGFIEYCYFDTTRRKWSRQSDALYCFVEVNHNDKNIAILDLYPLLIAYRAGDDCSGILGWGEFENTNIMSIQTLYDPLNEVDYEYNLKDFSNFNPQICIVNFFTSLNGIPITIFRLSTSPDIIKFSIDENFASFEINKNINEIYSKCMSKRNQIFTIK